MAQTSFEEDRLKELLKNAIVEVLEERKDFFHDLIREVVEDIALTNAIKEGESTESVDRTKVFEILEGQE